MNQSIELLEDLQKTYAFQYDLTIMLTDEYGELVLPAEGNNQLCNTLLHQDNESLLDEIKDSLNQKWNISKPIVYDVLPGIHVVVAPVKSGSESTYFLWAGVMVEEQTRDLVKEHLHTKFQVELEWEEVLEQTPTITKENRQKWIERTNKLADLAALCLQYDKGTSAIQLPTELLRETTKYEEFDFSELLHRFLVHIEEFDFLGLAEQEKEDLYEVTQITGSGAESFRGATFSPGEGFLGRVLLTGKYAYWENVESDPRSVFFRSYEFRPKSLFCEPIRQHDGSISLLFGGSFSKRRISNEEAALGKTLTVLLEVSLSIHSLRLENTQQLNRLTSLVDICRLMASTPDLKRILFILVDISINLVEGPFSCVIFKDIENDKMKLVSRGDIKGNLGEYAEDLARRYYDSFAQSLPDHQEPRVHQINEYEQAIECPLCHGDDLLGILCVGVDDLSETQLREHLAFLHTLSIIGAVSLQLAKQGDTGGEEDRKVEALYRAVEQFDLETFAVMKEAATLTAEFTTVMGMPAIAARDAIHACQLSFYPEEFIRDNFPGSQIPDILSEGRALSECRPSGDSEDVKTESQVFSLVYTYVAGGRKIEEISHLEGTANELYSKFVSFVEDKQVVEQEFTLTDGAATGQKSRSLEHAIKTKVKLSAREQEVLALVMEGLNNRGIAEALYISDHTVKNHVTKIFKKLEVSDRAQAISKVYQLMYEQQR
jgi:DNA-binding CsgD family transcriptional regulator